MAVMRFAALNFSAMSFADLWSLLIFGIFRANSNWVIIFPRLFF